MKDTIFFGNGLNRLSANPVSWEDLLDKIKEDLRYSNQELPYTFIYENALLHNNGHPELRLAEENIKIEIAEQMSLAKTNEFYSRLKSLPVSNYITTNYDDAILGEQVSYKVVDNDNSEKVYSIRRFKEYSSIEEGIFKLWKIHGDIHSPKTIMLGLDHYCGSISKIDSYLKGQYQLKDQSKVKSIEEKLREFENNSENVLDHSSWVELMFFTNVHILGFSLDFSETDLWWILNKRARIAKENNVRNKIYYYVDSKINVSKELLFESFDVEVIDVRNGSSDYKEICHKSIDSITEKIIQNN